MRGKIKIWTIAAIFIASLTVSMLSVPKAFADNIVFVTPYEWGPKNPGDSFSVDVEVDYAEGVRAFEFTLSWNPKILRLQPVPAVEGPFLPMGGPTYFVKSVGVAGESITVADLITVWGWADGSGVLATVYFEVIGGGETDVGLTAKLLDVDFNEMYGVETTGAHFWSKFPFVDFTWFVPTAVEMPPQDTVDVTGYGYYVTYGEDGDMYLLPLPSTTRTRPVLALNDADGTPEGIVNVQSGTMFFGDEIIFDATACYDLDNAGNPVPSSSLTYQWVIRGAGQDTILYRGTTYDSKYESGVELGSDAVMSYVFPGALPSMYTLYGAVHLGWFDLTLKVTDADNNEASLHTWIRIYRLAPARTVMAHVPNPKHSLSKDGNTMIIEGKIQNRGGASDFPYDALASYLELARMIHGFMWGRMQFDIIDQAGNIVDTAYTDAYWLGPTELPISPMSATWTIPDGFAPGVYTVKAKAYFCASGVTYGMTARGTLFKTLEILP